MKVAALAALTLCGCVVMPLPQAGRYMNLVDPATGKIGVQWDFAQDGMCGKLGNVAQSFIANPQQPMPFTCSNISQSAELPVKAVIRATNYPHPMQLAFSTLALCQEGLKAVISPSQAQVIESCTTRP